jgi:hypothetical protein
MVPVGS